MSEPSSTPLAEHAPRLFDPLEPTDFARMEHAASLKGLLRPFKGKGSLEAWASQCDALRDGLITLAQRRVLAPATSYPFSLLHVGLAQQTTGAGTAFLRWRNADRSAMGVSLWADLIHHPSTPIALVHELFALELQRIALNLQVSLTHHIGRQAVDCAKKMAWAEAIYLRRVAQRSATSPKESTP